MIDLRRMHAVSVDPAARTATVGGGATMRHLDRATQLHGLADPFPVPCAPALHQEDANEWHPASSSLTCLPVGFRR